MLPCFHPLLLHIVSDQKLDGGKGRPGNDAQCFTSPSEERVSGSGGGTKSTKIIAISQMVLHNLLLTIKR